MPHAISGAAGVAQKPTALEIESGEANDSRLGRIVTVDVVATKWTSVWTSLITVDSYVSILKVCLHPLILLVCSDVLFATFVYGTALESQIILM